MSTGLIIAIIVVAIIIIALLVMLPRMRAAADRKKAERELHSRREAVAGEHRQAAVERESAPSRPSRRRAWPQQAAERERAEANLQHERASMHERGMADHELIDDDERDRFADVAGGDNRADADADGHTMDDRARAATNGDHDTTTPQEGTGSASPDYRQGREDERRFEQSGDTKDVPEGDRPRNA